MLPYFIFIYFLGFLLYFTLTLQYRYDHNTIESSLSTQFGIITTVLKVIFWPISTVYFFFKTFIYFSRYFKTLPWK